MAASDVTSNPLEVRTVFGRVVCPIDGVRGIRKGLPDDTMVSITNVVPSAVRICTGTSAGIGVVMNSSEG